MPKYDLPQEGGGLAKDVSLYTDLLSDNLIKRHVLIIPSISLWLFYHNYSSM
jgi:hypothetical protein